MSTLSRRQFNRVAAVMSLGLAGFSPSKGRAAEVFPAKPIRLVVPWPVGGATDVIARVLAEKLTGKIGQSVIVDNRAGATGYIGTQNVLQSKPDGYTLLLMAASVHSFSPSVMKTMPFNPVADFLPISLITTFPYVMVVPANSPYKSAADIIAAAKSRPGKVAFGSFGTGSAPHLISELFALNSGVKLLHVPYKGGSQALTDLLGGQYDFLIDSLPSPLPQIRAGKLKALAVTSAKRAAAVPDVASLAETIPGFDAISWLGIGGAANLPGPVADRIFSAIREITIDPDYGRKLRAIGAEPLSSNSPDAFRSFLVTEKNRWAKVVSDANIPKVE